MQTEVMFALQNCLKKDYSEKNQLKQIGIIRIMLEINQDVIANGISRLENYQSHSMSYPMLSKGLELVRGGLEPQAIETMLLNTAIANDVDLLESLLIIEGVISIQLLCSPDVTRELLISYFSFDMQDVLRKSLNDLKLNFIEPLNMKEIEKMLKVHSS